MTRPSSRRSAGLAALLLVVLGAACAGSGAAGPEIEVQSDWGTVFDDAGVAGTFALREVGTDTTKIWNTARANDARLPASTFKILNSLIILQTGVLPDVDTQVEWDGVERSVPSWNRAQSLRTAIEVSAVWAYQALAREVGYERMAEWVRAAGYGNADIGGGIDEFWLRGDLRISPIEQLDFLERLAERDLPFDTTVMDTVADILIREQGDGWAWSHKTGTALDAEPNLGWLVGITAHDGRSFVFAMNLDLEPVTTLSDELDPQLRQNIARTILRSAGALP